jgi:hypothetical protein
VRHLQAQEAEPVNGRDTLQLLRPSLGRSLPSMIMVSEDP